MMNRFVLTLVLAAVAALSNGCLLFVAAAGAGAGVGTYAYVSGELQATETVTLDKAWDASQAAMKDLSYSITEKQKDALQAKLVARGAGDKRVEVKLEKKSETVTQIGIRVGTFGDETLSRQILATMKSHF